LTFQLSHSGRSRSLDPEKIRSAIHFANLLKWTNSKISDEQEKNLLECAKIFRECNQPHKRIVYANWQYVYTNHESLLAQLHSLDFVKHSKLTEAAVTLPRDVVVLKNSQYQFRSYFSSRWFNREEVAAIKNFLVSRGTQFRTTLGVQSRLNGRFFYPNDWMFVDHNDEKDALLLNLVASQCIRKTLPIQIAK
jgi:hypothetical protein